jgi:Cu+-exporting ATPase
LTENPVFWVSTALAFPVFILAMIADLLRAWLPDGLSMKTVQWIEFALATPVVWWGGWPFFVRGRQSVQTWNLNMFTLLSLSFRKIRYPAPKYTFYTVFTI